MARLAAEGTPYPNTLIVIQRLPLSDLTVSLFCLSEGDSALLEGLHSAGRQAML